MGAKNKKRKIKPRKKAKRKIKRKARIRKITRRKIKKKAESSKKKTVKKRKVVRKKAVSRRIKKGTFVKKVRSRKLIKLKTKPKKKRKKHRTLAHQLGVRRSAGKALLGKPIYALNPGFEFFYELKDLILKSSPAEKDRMIQRLNKIGRIKLAVISGIFINKENLDPLITDLFIVGDDIDRRKMRAFLKATEAEVGKEIRFTIMDKEEFQYRLAMFDRFIRVLLESPHEKLINRLGI